MWASDSEHRIKTFTELWQIGIDDSALSETDFFANIQLIAEMMPNYSRLELFCHGALNFTKSLNRQLFIDGAFPTEAPAQDGVLRVEKNHGVSLGIPLEYRLNYSDTRIIGRYDVNSGNKVWYPFRVIATTEALNIRTYTTLEQIGLSDADMAEDDFVGNLAKINIALGAGYVRLFIMLSDGQPNLRESLLARMENDGIECRSIKEDIGEFTLFLDRPVDIYRAIKVEVMMDIYTLRNKVRNKTIIAYANRDGQNMNVYPFKEVATTDYGVITPLNGWESPGSTPVAVRSGRYVDINFGFENGVVTHGTVIGKVPEGFRPCETRTIPVLADAHAENARLVVYTNGDIKLFGANEATKRIVGTGGFMI